MEPNEIALIDTLIKAVNEIAKQSHANDRALLDLTKALIDKVNRLEEMVDSLMTVRPQ